MTYGCIVLTNGLDSSFPAKRKQRAQSGDDIDDLPEAPREVAFSDMSYSGLQTRPRKRAKHIENVEEPKKTEDDIDSGLAFPRLKLGRYCCVPLKFSEPVYFTDEEKNWDLSIFADTPNESENEWSDPSKQGKNNTADRNPSSSKVGEVEGGVRSVCSLITGEYEETDFSVVDRRTVGSENEGSEPALSQGGREEQEMDDPNPSSRSVIEADNEPDTPSQPTPLQEVWLRHRERLTEEYESTGSTLLPAWFLEEVECHTLTS